MNRYPTVNLYIYIYIAHPRGKISSLTVEVAVQGTLETRRPRVVGRRLQVERHGRASEPLRDERSRRRALNGTVERRKNGFRCDFVGLGGLNPINPI